MCVSRGALPRRQEHTSLGQLARRRQAERRQRIVGMKHLLVRSTQHPDGILRRHHYGSGAPVSSLQGLSPTRLLLSQSQGAVSRWTW